MPDNIGTPIFDFKYRYQLKNSISVGVSFVWPFKNNRDQKLNAQEGRGANAPPGNSDVGPLFRKGPP